MHQWTTLHAGKQLPIDLLRMFFLAKYQPAARAAKRLVRCRSHVISVRHRRRMKVGRNRARDVGDVGKHARADAPGDFADAFEVDNTRIGRSAADN